MEHHPRWCGRTNSLIMNLEELLNWRLLEGLCCRRWVCHCVCTVANAGREAAVMPRALRVLSIWVADCFESSVGVMIVLVQLIVADVVG